MLAYAVCRHRIHRSPTRDASVSVQTTTGPGPSERDSAETLENIHPFTEGNGRIGRQILNMMLMQAGYEPIAIKHDAGRTYAGRLEQWQAYGNPAPLARMVAGYVVREQDRIGKIVSDIRRGHPIARHTIGVRK